MIRLTSESIAYFAGLFDGEGCIMASMIKRKGGTYNAKVVVRVAMTHEAAVKQFQLAWGGSVHYHIPTNPKHRPSWAWNLPQRKSEAFLEAVYPYLVVKKEEADYALALLGRIRVTQPSGPKALSSEELQIRCEMVQRIKEQKGRL